MVDSTLMLDNFSFGTWGAPTVSATNGVLNGASFLPQIAPNSWISLFGHRFSTSARLWGGSDFSGTNLPTRVDDASVTIGGKAALCVGKREPVERTRAGGRTRSPTTLVVIRAGISGTPVPVEIQRIAPALFMFDAGNRKYVAANHVNGTPVGDPGLYPGVTTPARPGEVVTICGARGSGRTDPDIPAGQIVTAAGRLVAVPVIIVAGATADVQFAGLTIAGVYQFNVHIPDGIPDGDAPVIVQVEGTTTQSNAYITVKH